MSRSRCSAAHSRDPSVILELWPPPAATIEKSVAKEAAWTRQSIEFLRRWVKD